MNDTASTRDSLTADDFFAAAERLKQWGRWGADDEIGTLNNVSPEAVIAAGQLVRSGKTFGLALGFDGNGPQGGEGAGSWRFNPVHTMFLTGTDCCAYPERYGPMGGADDMITMPLQCGTQWDALSHVFFQGQMWNGYDAKLVSSFGAAKNGIEKTRDKMVGRGVLLDIPHHLGLPWLPDGYGIGPELLDACAQAEGLEIRAGDFLLVHTGQMKRCLSEGKWGTFSGGDAPGMKFSTADWVREKDIAAVATDTWGVEVRPNEIPGMMQPWHMVIPILGLTLGEMFYLQELAEDCAKDGVYEFLFCGAALPFTGAVGCPLNPMAIK